MKNFYSILVGPVNKWFYCILILNLVSNLSYCYNSGTFSLVLMTIALSVVIAYFESLVYCVLPYRWIKTLYMFLLVTFHMLLCVAEYFCLINFQKVINQDVVDIVAETRLDEIRNFVQTYMGFGDILLIIIVVIVSCGVIYGISRLLSRLKNINVPILVFLIAGLCIYAKTTYYFVMYKNGMSVPQLTSVTRVAYSFYILNNKIKDIEKLLLLCKSVEAVPVYGMKAPNIIFVIGESYSKFHSSLYDYGYSTNPLLAKHKSDSSLVLFNDAITTSDFTHAVMKSIFSLSKYGNSFSSAPLFPICFKEAGYMTYMYDNQYLPGNGLTFLTHKELSNLLFDYRNMSDYTYDDEMVADIADSVHTDTPCLYVIHLKGQHYNYENCYPESFAYFTKKDYEETRYTDEQKVVVAHYDNATRYNDYVVNSIIEKFMNTNSCIVYISDHGEEVYDVRDYMGHGNAATSPDINYQIRIPMMIYMTSAFKDGYPEVVDRIWKNRNTPIVSDDISHVLLDLAGIRTACFDSTRSFVNEKYDSGRHRVVLKSIDFDALHN